MAPRPPPDHHGGIRNGWPHPTSNEIVQNMLGLRALGAQKPKFFWVAPTFYLANLNFGIVFASGHGSRAPPDHHGGKRVGWPHPANNDVVQSLRGLRTRVAPKTEMFWGDSNVLLGKP